MRTACSKHTGFSVVNCGRVLAKLLIGIVVLRPLSGAAAESVVLSADTSRPDTSTYAAGEPAAVKFSILHLKPNQASRLNVSIVDENGHTVAAPSTVKIVADATGTGTGRISVPTNRLGYYEVHAALKDGTTLSALGSRPAGFISYAVVPDPARRVDYGDAGSRFGMQGGFSASANEIAYLGIRYLIQGAAGWADHEPNQAGEFSARRQSAARTGSAYPEPEPAIRTLQYHDQHWPTYYIATVTRASLPAWAIKQGTSGKVCRTFGALQQSAEAPFTQFSRSQAEAFHVDYLKQRNRYYQVTWEPADWCYQGSAADLVRMYSLAYETIHHADSGALIAGPTLFPDTASTTQLRELWKAGLGRYIDVLSVHPYSAWPPETKGDLIHSVHSQLAEARQAAGRDIPLIGTEHGYKSAEIGNLNKALGDIRSTLIVLGEGAQIDFGFYIADFWSGPDPLQSEGFGYYWNLNPHTVWGTDKIGPKAIVPAYAAMTCFLDGTVSDGPIKNLQGGQVGYRFHRANSAAMLVLWQPEGTSSYPVGAGMRICDWMGNCSDPTPSGSIIRVGQSPTYIIDARP
jgi:hypothetical protein